MKWQLEDPAEGDVPEWMSLADRDCGGCEVQNLKIEDVRVDESEYILIEGDSHDSCYWDCVSFKE